MLILGVENPQGEVRYLAAAFPPPAARPTWPCSSPGALPEGGLEGLVCGDDIAWLRIGEDGTVGHEPGVRLLRRGPRHQCQI
ncbi:phosphoenolpyruvate carboxykinase (GTP) [Flavonifractor plautii]|nr:phosphoenolpyruvate carboxykinase (GTP) [Flavonifractor plautii]